MAQQLTFDLPGRAASGRDDFFVSQANGAAVAAISGWQGWQAGKLVLCGPPGSGKTHLVQVWAKDAGAKVLLAGDLKDADLAGLAARSARIAIEDIQAIAGDDQAELALFHLHNLVLGDGGRILLTGRTAPAHWPLALPDLKSRLLGTALTRLSPPDDPLLAAVLVKLFGDRQIEVSPDLIGYITLRIERSFAAAGQIVAALDARSLAQRRAVTRDLARQVLDSIVWKAP